MSEGNQPERVWDEYDWERFLQEQDRKTEKYMELLEHYIDHPDRDQIIAREMGWNHLLNKEGQEWAEEVDSQFAYQIEEDEEEADEEESEEEETGEGEEGAESYRVHPLYQAMLTLSGWLDDALAQGGDELRHHPIAAKLSMHAMVAGNKLVAALSDDDIDEIGMTIAYLKRAVCSIMGGLECAVILRDEKVIDGECFGALNYRLFQVRDGIIELMGEYRGEWRRRFGR